MSQRGLKQTLDQSSLFYQNSQDLPFKLPQFLLQNVNKSRQLPSRLRTRVLQLVETQFQILQTTYHKMQDQKNKLMMTELEDDRSRRQKSLVIQSLDARTDKIKSGSMEKVIEKCQKHNTKVQKMKEAYFKTLQYQRPNLKRQVIIKKALSLSSVSSRHSFYRTELEIVLPQVQEIQKEVAPKSRLKNRSDTIAKTKLNELQYSMRLERQLNSSGVRASDRHDKHIKDLKQRMKLVNLKNEGRIKIKSLRLDHNDKVNMNNVGLTLEKIDEKRKVRQQLMMINNERLKKEWSERYAQAQSHRESQHDKSDKLVQITIPNPVQKQISVLVRSSNHRPRAESMHENRVQEIMQQHSSLVTTNHIIQDQKNKFQSFYTSFCLQHK